MKKYHYVYLLTNTTPFDERKYYFGVRSCDVLPKHDNYFSSSKLIKKLIKTKFIFNKKIIKQFSNRKEALLYEIFLHNAHDVANNKYFYNLAKQSLNMLDSSGGIFINGEWISSIDYKNSDKKFHTYGKITLKDEFDNYFQVDVNDSRRLTGELIPLTKGLVPIRTENGSYKLISKELYNKEKHKSSNFEKIPVIDAQGNTFLINSDDVRYSNGELKSVHKNKVLCRNENGRVMLLPKDEYKKNNYSGINKGLICGDKNPNSKKIEIYNSNNELMFTCLGNFKEICKINNLPTASLGKSYRNNGHKIFQTKKSLKNYDNFVGWYAKIIK